MVRNSILAGFLLATAGTPSVFAAGEQDIARIAGSPEWRKLLHYRESSFGKPRSGVDDRDFFLSGLETGKTDPEAELRGTLQKFHAPAGTPWGKIRQHPLCAFPARREFLERQGFRFPPQPCPDFSEWEAGIGAKSVALVYSSSYPGNPASLFGHTFLRFDRSAEREERLLSYGANFAALSDPGDSSITYAVKGLFGGYVGRYGLSPYYLKVNEYNHSESRDLWEFELSLSPDRVSFLLKHLWELYGNASFDYYFLDENCSYQILTALEAAAPDWELVRGFHLYVLPIESVLRVSRIPGAVTRVRYRPSNRRSLLNAYEALSLAERKLARALVRGDLTALPDASAPALNTAVLAYSLEKSRSNGKLSPEASKRMREILLARSRLGKSDRENEDSPFRQAIFDHGPGPVRPDRFHLTSRAAIAYGDSRGEGRFARFALAGFHHDFLNADAGFDSFALVRVATLEFERAIDVRDTRFRSFEAIAMDSLYPFQPIDPKLSWSVRLAFDRAWETGCFECTALRGHGGVGSGVEVFSPETLLYGMAEAELQASGRFENSVRLAPGVRVGLITQPFRSVPFRVSLAARSRWDVVRNAGLARAAQTAEAGVAYAFGQHWDLRMLSEWRASGAIRESASRIEASVFF